jgi:hypothetical protein
MFLSRLHRLQREFTPQEVAMDFGRKLLKKILHQSCFGLYF